MSDERINIDDLFRDELGSYAETPPPAAWSALEKKLAARPGGPASRTRRVWYLGLLCLVLLLSIPAIKQLPVVSGNDEQGSATNETNAAYTIDPAGSTAGNNGGPGAQGAPAEKPGNGANSENEQPSNAITDNAIAGAQTEAADNKTPGNNRNTVVASNNKQSNKTSKSTKYTAANNKKTEGNEQLNPDEWVVVHDYAPTQANQYNGMVSNPGPDEAESNEQDEDIDDQKRKDEKPPIDNDTNKNKPNSIKPPQGKPVYKKFDLGIKVGYERGFDNYSARKFLISPYLQYNISPKIAVMTQPSVKYAQTDSRNLNRKNSYYQVKNSDVKQTTDSVPVYIVVGGIVDSLWMWKNAYTQTHDSIVKSYEIRNTYFEFDAPILMKYNLSKTFSVYGGVNFTYSRLASVQENTYTEKDISRSVTKTTLGRANTPAPAPQQPGEVFVYNATPYSNYSPLYPTTVESSWRIGYMVGFSYEFTNRWLVDALVQQSTVKPNMQDGYNLNTAISAPYVRFTLGYKLLK